jgi:hypothetical protein
MFMNCHRRAIVVSSPRANQQIEAGYEHAALQPVMLIPTIAVSSMVVVLLLLAAQTDVLIGGT